MKRILLDTSAYVAFKRGDPEAVAVLRRAPGIGLCAIVIGELLAGFACGRQVTRNRRELAEFLASPRVEILPTDAETAEHYASAFALLRRQGRPIPTNDLWIAATALQYGYAVLTRDAHFSAVENLLCGSTLADFLP